MSLSMIINDEIYQYMSKSIAFSHIDTIFSKPAVIINFKERHFASEIIRFDLSSSTLANIYSSGWININAGQKMNANLKPQVQGVQNGFEILRVITQETHLRTQSGDLCHSKLILRELY